MRHSLIQMIRKFGERAAGTLDELLKENKGKIDVALAEKMLGDPLGHGSEKGRPNERVLCGHVMDRRAA